MTDLTSAAKRLAYVTWNYQPPNPGAEEDAFKTLARAVDTLAGVGIGLHREGPPRYVLTYEESRTAGFQLQAGALCWEGLELPSPVLSEAPPGGGQERQWGTLLAVERESPVIWALVDRELPEGYALSPGVRLGSAHRNGPTDVITQARLVEVRLVPDPTWKG